MMAFSASRRRSRKDGSRDGAVQQHQRRLLRKSRRRSRKKRSRQGGRFEPTGRADGDIVEDFGTVREEFDRIEKTSPRSRPDPSQQHPDSGFERRRFILKEFEMLSSGDIPPPEGDADPPSHADADEDDIRPREPQRQRQRQRQRQPRHPKAKKSKTSVPKKPIDPRTFATADSILLRAEEYLLQPSKPAEAAELAQQALLLLGFDSECFLQDSDSDSKSKSLPKHVERPIAELKLICLLFCVAAEGTLGVWTRCRSASTRRLLLRGIRLAKLAATYAEASLKNKDYAKSCLRVATSMRFVILRYEQEGNTLSAESGARYRVLLDSKTARLAELFVSVNRDHDDYDWVRVAECRWLLGNFYRRKAMFEVAAGHFEVAEGLFRDNVKLRKEGGLEEVLRESIHGAITPMVGTAQQVTIEEEGECECECECESPIVSPLPRDWGWSPATDASFTAVLDAVGQSGLSAGVPRAARMEIGKTKDELQRRLEDERLRILKRVAHLKRYSRVHCARNCISLAGTFCLEDEKRQLELYRTALALQVGLLRPNRRFSRRRWDDATAVAFFRTLSAVIDMMVTLAWRQRKQPEEALAYVEVSKSVAQMLFMGTGRRGGEEDLPFRADEKDGWRRQLHLLPHPKHTYVVYYLVRDCLLSPDRVYRWVIRKGSVAKWDFRNLYRLGVDMDERRDELEGESEGAGVELLSLDDAVSTFTQVLRRHTSRFRDVLRGDSFEGAEQSDGDEGLDTAVPVDPQRADAGSDEDHAAKHDPSRAACRRLHELLVDGLEEHLPVAEEGHIVVIPDKILFKVPFACLLDKFGEYFIEKHQFSVNTSLQMVRANHVDMQEARKVRRLQETKTSDVFVTSLICGYGQYVGKAAALPRSKQECENIARMMRHVHSPEVEKISSVCLFKSQLVPDAVEACALTVHPRAIHIAAHCTTKKKKKRKRKSKSKKDDGEEFTGPQQQGQDHPPPFAEYRPCGHFVFSGGLPLYAQTIADMWHLRGTEFVYLSACESADGKVAPDGVLGFHRAFFAAGVPSVLCTLWNVFDKVSCFVAEKFYSHVIREVLRVRKKRRLVAIRKKMEERRSKMKKKGKSRRMTPRAEAEEDDLPLPAVSKATALRMAILCLMKGQRGRYRQMPIMWAPYQLFGEPNW